jgi:hypothetical protein
VLIVLAPAPSGGVPLAWPLMLAAGPCSAQLGSARAVSGAGIMVMMPVAVTVVGCTLAGPPECSTVVTVGPAASAAALGAVPHDSSRTCVVRPARWHA